MRDADCKEWAYTDKGFANVLVATMRIGNADRLTTPFPPGPAVLAGDDRV